MRGLLYKNLFGSKRESLMMLIVTGAMTLFAIVVGTPALTPCIGAVVGLCVMAPAASIQLDKQSGWNKFICASPIPRHWVMLALYLSTLLSNGFFVCLLLLINLCAGSFPYWLFLVILALALVVQAITLPVGLRLGQVAVVIIFMGVVFGFSGLSMVLSRFGILTDQMIEAAAAVFLRSPWLSASLTLLAGAALFALSYLVSYHIYRKMEF